MKPLLSKLLLPALLLPFCFGSGTLEKGGYFTPQYFPPLESGKEYYDIELTYTYTEPFTSSEISFRLDIYREHQAGVIEVHNIDTFYVPSMAVPYTTTFVTKIDYDYFYDGDNRNCLIIQFTNEGYQSEGTSFFLNYRHNYIINITKERSSYERPSIEGWYETFDDSGNGYLNGRYEWRGFTQDFVNPDYMILPMNKWKLRYRNQKGLYQYLNPVQATLTIHDTESFLMGRLVQESYHTKRRVVYLSVLRGSSYYTYFRTKEKIVYSPDYRSVRTNGRSLEGDHESYAIFLPPIKKGTLRRTKFELKLIGVGENRQDTVTYTFYVTQTYNYVGSYPTSIYYVEEC